MLPVKTIKKSNQHQNPNINLEFHNVVGQVLTKNKTPNTIWCTDTEKRFTLI